MGKEAEGIRESVAAAAGEMAEKLVAWQAAHPQYTLSELEKELLVLRERLGQQVAETMVERRQEQQPVPGPSCKTCGEEMQYKDRRSLQQNSRLGELKLERGYYYCTHCESGIFPPG